MIIVFGANGVLGSEICSQLLSSNNKILIVANNGFEDIKKKYSSNINVAYIKKCNVQVDDDIQKLFKFIEHQKIDLKGVINNFAYTFDSSIINHNSGSDEVKKVFDVNYHGVSRVLEELVSFQKNTNNKNIRVVNILSNSLKTLNASNHHYIASKAAIENLASYYAKNFAEKMSINNVCPGLMKSKITNERFDKVVENIESLTPLKRLASPVEVAQIITYLSSNSPLSLCGQTIYIDGGRTI
jgi:NAD(P)-dependent dehydrogenase (short-subunit alcohol dehydrogenase family)